MAEDRTVAEMTGNVLMGGSDVNVTLRLKATKPFERGGKWFTTLIAYLSRDSKRPIPNQPLFVHRNGADAGVINSKTKAQGQFSCDVELPGPGEYVLTVGVFETDLWAGVTINVPATAVKTPAAIKIEKLREEGTLLDETTRLRGKRVEFREKPKASKLQIRILDKFVQGTQLVVHLDVADKDGDSIGGKIHYLDDDGTTGSLKKEIIVRKSSPVISRFNLTDAGRQFTLRLASDPSVSALVDVPAKALVVAASVASTIPKPVPQMTHYEAYMVGYNRTRKQKTATITPTVTP